MEKLNIVGYIASDPFADGFVSHQVQNASIKNFLNLQNKNLLLSWAEYQNQGGTVFKSLLKEDFYQGICLFSMEQLWQLKSFPNPLEVLKKRCSWVGFARENIFFENENDFKKVCKLLWLKKQVAKESPTWL